MGVSNFGLKVWPEVEFCRFCACAAENWLKILEIMVQFSKFLVIKEIKHVDLKSEVKFYTGRSFMAVSAHAHWKWPKGFKTCQYWQKFRTITKPGRENLIFDLIFYPEVLLWPFLRMHNSKWGRKPKRKHEYMMVHLRKVHIQKRTSHV